MNKTIKDTLKNALEYEKRQLEYFEGKVKKSLDDMAKIEDDHFNDVIEVEQCTERINDLKDYLRVNASE